MSVSVFPIDHSHCFAKNILGQYFRVSAFQYYKGKAYYSWQQVDFLFLKLLVVSPKKFRVILATNAAVECPTTRCDDRFQSYAGRHDK